MKKIVLLGIIFLSINLTAQEVKFGVKAGINLSSLRYDPESELDLKLKTGFLAGGIFQYKMNEKYALEAQLLYAQQGVRNELTFTKGGGPNPSDPSIGTGSETLKGKIKLKYINLPILARYYFTKNLSINSGPQLGYLISAKDKFEEGELDIKDNFSDIDLGLNAGVGYGFTNGIILNATYYLGLKDLFAVENPFSEREIKQRVIQFSVGYLF